MEAKMADNKHLTPVHIMYADGKRLDTEHEGALREIVIHDTLNGISSFSVLFDTAESKIADKGILSLESQLSIHLGYKDDVEEVFFGEILEMKAVFSEYATEQLEVSGCNVLHKLAHGEHSRSFEKMTASDRIKGIIESYSLKAKLDDFGAQAEFSSQDGYTDYDYLIDTANLYGKDVFADKDMIYVANEISIRSDEIILEWGKSLISFEGSLNMKHLLSAYNYIGWDPLKGESFTGEAVLSGLPLKVGGSHDWTKVSKGGSGKFSGSVSDLRLFDADEAKQRAIGLLQKNSFQFGQAHAKMEGNYKLRPGRRVNIKMVGEKFEGEYIAEQVIHRFDYSNGYTTSVRLKRNCVP
jgi:phage protein D